MEKKSFITNEELKGIFKDKLHSTSQFDLVNYAIRLAEKAIAAGSAADPQTQDQSLAIQVLDKMLAGRDLLVDVQRAKESSRQESAPALIIEEEVRSSKSSKSAKAKPANAPGSGEGKPKVKKALVAAPAVATASAVAPAAVE